ncbi:MAG: hypothetical protein FWF63_00755 [Fibromonadales bacterium]|nr:hypothetical protein [Fibromonadales bacterium]
MEFSVGIKGQQIFSVALRKDKPQNFADYEVILKELALLRKAIEELLGD